MNLKELLDYELHSSHRYRRFVSIVMMTCKNNNDIDLKDRLSEHIRTSDAPFKLKKNTAILMGETDLNSALQAVKRYKNKFKKKLDLRVAVVSYPNDGHTSQDLLTTLSRRLDEAKMGKRGAMVTTG